MHPDGPCCDGESAKESPDSGSCGQKSPGQGRQLRDRISGDSDYSGSSGSQHGQSDHGSRSGRAGDRSGIQGYAEQYRGRCDPAVSAAVHDRRLCGVRLGQRNGCRDGILHNNADDDGRTLSFRSERRNLGNSDQKLYEKRHSENGYYRRDFLYGLSGTGRSHPERTGGTMVVTAGESGDKTVTFTLGGVPKILKITVNE